VQPETITGPIDAMRSDAAIWQDISEELDAAAAVADRLDLTAVHFSAIADWAGLTDLYREVQDRMVRLMREGAEVHRKMADGLRWTADTFEEAEATAGLGLTND
jgi:uncharacterized protein YukE